MPELTSVPDSERPIGQFITEQVLPRWESMNAYPRFYKHIPGTNRSLGQRAIQVRQVHEADAAFVHNGRIVGGRRGRETTLVSDQASEACTVKSLTRAYWNAADVPTISAKRFSPGEATKAAHYVASSTTPLVMKPDSGREGAGLSVNVTTASLDQSWMRATKANRVPTIGDSVLIEQFQDALCLRFFVVGSEVRGVTLRIPLFVAGDGRSTVHQLLDRTFEDQQRNAWLRSVRPKINDELIAASGLTLEDVPPKGSLRILNENPNVLLGGIPYDVSAIVSHELKALAVEAVLAIPGLGAAGVDVLTRSLNSANTAVALDADSRASLHMHRHPAFGKHTYVGLAIANQLRLRADHWERPVYSGSAQYAESPDE